MAEVSEIRSPYEFLARWDESGALVGAHVCFRTRVMVDGAVMLDRIEPAEPIARGAEACYPLSDLLEQLQLDALLRADRLESENRALRAELAALQDQSTG
jgi:hypothetical protein